MLGDYERRRRMREQKMIHSIALRVATAALYCAYTAPRSEKLPVSCWKYFCLLVSCDGYPYDVYNVVVMRTGSGVCCQTKQLCTGTVQYYSAETREKVRPFHFSSLPFLRSNLGLLISEPIVLALRLLQLALRTSYHTELSSCIFYAYRSIRPIAKFQS